MKWLDGILRRENAGFHIEIRQFASQAADDETHYPSTIDPRILHVKVVLDHLGDLHGKRVADVGCGKGRFARIIQERFPDASVYALDLAEAMLAHVPPRDSSVRSPP